MNVILATGNRSVDRYVGELREVTVLTTLNRREQVVDRTLELNPHVLLLANSLGGKLEFREILKRIRALKPGVRIVFLYGAADGETTLFLDFLIRNGIYDFLVGGIDEWSLKKVLTEPSELKDVEPYLLPDQPAPEPADEPADASADAPTLTAAPVSIPTAPPRELEVLIVEKIVERETVKKEYIGHITVGVAGLFPHSGVTHTALMAARYLRRQKRDACAVVSPAVYEQLRSYYQITGSKTEIAGVPIYEDYAEAVNNHVLTVVDDGQAYGSGLSVFYARTVKLLVCPSAPWEIDALTDFLRDNSLARHVGYLFWPVTDKYFRELRANMERGGCSSWKLTCTPDWMNDTTNDRVFEEALKEVMKC